MALLVKGPVVVLPEKTTGLTRYYYQGAVLPDGLDEDRVQGVIDAGLVEEVDDVAAPAESDGEQSADSGAREDSGDAEGGVSTPPVAGKPTQADNKAAWVDYAVANGADRAEAEQLNKSDLVELYK